MKTLKEAMMCDVEDESLVRYKESLLGDLKEEVKQSCNLAAPMDPPFVEIECVEFVCSDREGGNIKLEMEALDDEEKNHQASEYVLKEGSRINMRVTFRVHNDIVVGLKLCTKIKKAKVEVSSSEEILGSFPPTKESHVVNLTPEETPSGWFKRTSYKGKAMFVDMDGIVHMRYNFDFKIEKTW